MIIGTSRVGIGRIGIRSGNYSTASVTTNASIQDWVLANILTNANIVDIVALDLTTNADVIDYYLRQLTTNANIIGIDILELLTNAYISEYATGSITSNAHIAQQIAASLPSNAYISERTLLPLTTNASISAFVTALITSNAHIAQQIAASLTSNAYILEYVAASITSNAQISLDYMTNIATSAEIVDYAYWAVGPSTGLINLTKKVYDPQARGFGLKTSEQRIPQAPRVELTDLGNEGGSYEFEAEFRSEPEKNALLAAVNRDASDLIFYPGRSDRFFRVAKVSDEPGFDEPWRLYFTTKIKLLLEDPYLYHYKDQGLSFGMSLLPFTSTSVYNFGTVESPILFTVGGAYVGSSQLTSVYARLMNGSTEETSLYITPQILHNEYAQLDYDGSQKYYLKHTYQSTYDEMLYWPHDAVQSGCTLSGGAVSVPALGWYYYLFQGNPLRENIKLIATITKTGSPIIQYSTDGITWTTSISASEIVSGVATTYWLTGTEKQSTVYVRFYCPAGATMSIGDVDFLMYRDISSQIAQIPQVQPGDVRTLKIVGSGAATARVVNTEFRCRWRP